MNLAAHCFIGICVFGFVAVFGAETEYKNECIVDSSKLPTEADNYKDCTGEEHVADGSTDCCNVDGVIDCCNKSASWWTMIWICIGIGTTTIVLSLLCFWIYWCDEQTCPWVGPYKRRWDEKTGACMKKYCRCCVNEDDDDDDYEKTSSEKKGPLPGHEIRPASSLSSPGQYTDDRVLTPSSIDSRIVDVQPGTESVEMPPEYQAEVKDDFLNF